jgi:HSP20 family molecular chaperone IbpA
MQGIAAVQGTNTGDAIGSYMRQNGVAPEQYYKPPCDLVETTEKLVIYIDAPGVRGEDIDVDFYNTKLDLVIKRGKPYDGEPRLRRIAYGEFKLRVELPISVTSSENVDIQLENGVIVLTIDKAKEERNRFSVRVGS